MYPILASDYLFYVFKFWNDLLSGYVGPPWYNLPSQIIRWGYFITIYSITNYFSPHWFRFFFSNLLLRTFRLFVDYAFSVNPMLYSVELNMFKIQNLPSINLPFSHIPFPYNKNTKRVNLIEILNLFPKIKCFYRHRETSIYL